MKKGERPLAVIPEDRDRTPEEKLLISVMANQVKEYLAAKEIGEDFGQVRKNVKLMIQHFIQKKFEWQSYLMAFLDQYAGKELTTSRLYFFLEGLDQYYHAESKIYRYRRKWKILDRGSMAEAYIFDENRDMERDVFSFAQICKMIELDPGKFRKRLRSLDRDEIKQIKETLREEV